MHWPEDGESKHAYAMYMPGQSERQTCSACGGDFPYPVELHHTQEECDAALGPVMVSGDDLHEATVYRDNGRWTCRLCGRQAMHADGSIGYGVMHTDGCFLVATGIITNRNRRRVRTP